LLEFTVAYGFQFLGALVFLAIGLKVAGWFGRCIVQLSLKKEINQTLSEFIGMAVKILIIGVLAIINSNGQRVVQTKVAAAGTEDAACAMTGEHLSADHEDMIDS